MSADDVKPYDLYRILIGEVPWSFLIEVIFRTAFIFLILLISMRLLGKRMAGQLSKNSISRERLFSQLRSKEITHLGEVKRVYFEAGGFFTLIKNNPVKPGLCIIPNWDLNLIAEKKHSQSERVCRSCGTLMKNKT